MCLSPLLSLLVEPVDVRLELSSVHAPETAAPDLDARQLSGSHERVDLGHGYRQVGGHIFERQEARLDSARAPRLFFRDQVARRQIVTHTGDDSTVRFPTDGLTSYWSCLVTASNSMQLRQHRRRGEDAWMYP